MDTKRPNAVDTLDRMTGVVRAASQLLAQVAAFMRQVVSVAGGIVLLVSTISLLTDVRPSPGHFIAPGAAALAVLQGAIKARSQRRTDEADKTSGDSVDDLPGP